MSKGSADATDRHVGNRVHVRRRMLHLSQMQLAKSVGVAFRQVQKYEMGINRISASQLYRIASALNVPVEFFFEAGPDSASPSIAVSSSAWPLNVLTSPECVELADGFMRIKDKKLRRIIVKLIEQAFAAQQDRQNEDSELLSNNGE